MNPNTKEVSRLINFRKPFIVFVGIMIGILLSYNFFVDSVLNNSVWWFYFVLILMAILLVTSILYRIIVKEKASIRLKNICILICLCLIAVFWGVIIALINLNILFDTYNFQGSGRIYATIYDIEEYEYGKSFVLEDVSIDADNGVVVLSGKVRVYIANSYLKESVDIGSHLSFVATVDSNRIFDENDCQKLINGYGYNVELDKSSDISVINGIVEFRNIVKNRIKDLLVDNMTQTNSTLAYSMLFGDKSNLDASVSDSFSISGVMHLLAVSGLHVAIIGGAFYKLIDYILRLFGVPYKKRTVIDLIVLGAILLFYAYLCSFSASVIRASIMLIVFILCQRCFIKYDALVSLSIAGIIILLVSPLSLLSVGFQLSFLCIFAIITLVPVLSKATIGWKIPRWIIDSILTSFAINLIITPVMLNSFGEASLISILANIVVIPLFSIVFPAIFFLALISAILPFFAFVLYIPNIALQLLRFVVDIFATIPVGVIESFRVGYICLGLLILFAFLFKYLMCNLRLKSICITLVFVVSIVVGLVNALPTTYNNPIMFIKHRYDTITTCLVDDGKTILFGNTNSISDDLLKDLKINNLDYLILYDFSYKDLDDIKQCAENNTDIIFFLDDGWAEFSSVFKENNLNVLFFDNKISIGSYCINIIKDYEDNLLAFLVQNANINVVYIPQSLSGEEYSFLGNELENALDYVIMYDVVDLESYNIITSKVLSNSVSEEENIIDLRNLDYYRLQF